LLHLQMNLAAAFDYCNGMRETVGPGQSFLDATCERLDTARMALITADPKRSVPWVAAWADLREAWRLLDDARRRTEGAMGRQYTEYLTQQHRAEEAFRAAEDRLAEVDPEFAVERNAHTVAEDKREELRLANRASNVSRDPNEEKRRQLELLIADANVAVSHLYYTLTLRRLRMLA
jgi:hypothetical protein